MANWIVFNLALSFLVFTLFYAMWCFVRTHLLYTRLNNIYNDFARVIKAATERTPGLEDEIHLDGTVARVLGQRDVCFEAASRLNAFTVAWFQDRNLDALVNQHVPICELPVVRSALTTLRSEKCEAIEFYIRYCRLSGYIWMLWAWIVGIRLDGLRKDLSNLIEVLVQPGVAEQFRQATQRFDLTYILGGAWSRQP